MLGTGMPGAMAGMPGAMAGMPGAMSGMPGAMSGMSGAMSGMSGNKALPLPPNQAQMLWQQFFLYRMIFGDAAARMIMADRLATMMGGNLISRYYAGEYFDTPDSWWLTSSLMNRNQNQAGVGATSGAANVPGAALPGVGAALAGAGAGSI
ncbi:uncharacterized protein LOC101852485 [Aplysia californica]|uniref:Uncharacterized protein LOC101852485 n=1 Tax=Aplysia californica TaxID=6500 RepID=A0ABM0JTH3_APLCA|nr:uncharacterized protein LOC101852485 [Aplysia californica]